MNNKRKEYLVKKEGHNFIVNINFEDIIILSDGKEYVVIKDNGNIKFSEIEEKNHKYIYI